MLVVWIISKCLRKNDCVYLMKWGEMSKYVSETLNAKGWATTYLLTCFLGYISEERKNKTHLTFSKTLLKQECQKGRGSDVIINVTDNDAMRVRMIKFQSNILNWYTPKSNYLCQSIDRVCSCVDLRDNNVISTPLSLKMPEILQAFCRCAARL
jgi:hypothetical protein